MGFLDRVKQALTTLRAERGEDGREAAKTAQDEPEKAGRETAATAPAATTEHAQAEESEAKQTQQEERTPAATKEHRTYTVRPGDTLPEIAARHGVDWREMAELNRLDNPDLIYPGQVFKVPHD